MVNELELIKGDKRLLKSAKKYVDRKFVITADMLQYITNVDVLDFMTDYCIFSKELYDSYYQTLVSMPFENGMENLWLVEIKMTPVVPGDIQTYVKLSERIQLFCEFDDEHDYELKFEFVKVIMSTDDDLMNFVYSNEYLFRSNINKTNRYYGADIKKEIRQIQKSILPWNEVNEKLTEDVPDVDQQHPFYYSNFY